MARVIVAEGRAYSFGSATLVYAQEDYALVVTNWHVVRDVEGSVIVAFPNGFRSTAQILKVDPVWDLAALKISSPQIQPVPLATSIPRPGDTLMIAGYGAGQYQSATGRCTQYVSPASNEPYEMVELSAEARQGDSGGPIFNTRGQLAGVLFGAGRGTTSGSYVGRVRTFVQIAIRDNNLRNVDSIAQAAPSRIPPVADPATKNTHLDVVAAVERFEASKPIFTGGPGEPPKAEVSLAGKPITWNQIAGNSPYEQAKTILAFIGMLAIAFQVMRLMSA